MSESDPLLDSGGDSVSVALRKDVEEQTINSSRDGDDEFPGYPMSYAEVLSDKSLRRSVMITLFTCVLLPSFQVQLFIAD